MEEVKFWNRYQGGPLEIGSAVYGRCGDVEFQLRERLPNGPSLIAESLNRDALENISSNLLAIEHFKPGLRP